MKKITFETAKSYVDLGWSIFPVNIKWDDEKKKYDKKPAVAWKDYQTRQPTEEELHIWFDESSYNGLGLVTGKISGVVVVDVEKSGLNLIDELHLDSGRISKTISGGRHYFYKWPGVEINNTVRIGDKDMDFRGDGGFVAIPPSHSDIAEYTWQRECVNSELPKLPTVINSDWQEVREPIKLSELTNQQEGSRNDSLYRAACSLLAKNTEEEAWTLINDINRTYSPPLTDQEVKQLFNSAYKFIKTEQPQQENEQRSEKLLMGEPVTWAKIKEDNMKRDWLWENFVAKGNITLFSALAKAGKTTLLRCLFVAMKNSEEFAGQPTRPCKVLILSEESASEWADGREGIDDCDIDQVYIWPRPTRGIPSSKDWIEIIDLVSKKCKELGIDMVVIDTISTFWPVDDENDAAKVKKALVPLYKLTDDNGVALMLVHHFKKDGGNEGTASRGSGALAGHVDNIIEFRRNEDGYPTQRKIKTMGRFIQETELIIELTNEGKYETKGEPWVVSKKARMTKILSLMTETARPMSVQEITSLWNSRLNKMSNKTIGRYVKELIVLGQCSLDNERTVQGKVIPFYIVTGWKESSQISLDNEKPPTTVPVQGELTVQATVQGQDQKTPWTGTVVTETELSKQKNYGMKEMPIEEDETIPF
jgi:predicted ATP-dependent serine protease